MLDKISNAYIGSNISNRLYSINDLVWPNTTGNLWKITDNPYNKTISNFNVAYVGGQVDVNWGAVISGNISSATNINHTFSGITNSGISVLPRNGANITAINCGASSPRLSGTVDISAFPNLENFTCTSNDISAIRGYENNSNIKLLRYEQNKVTGSIPSLTALPNLITYLCDRNSLTGQIPNLNNNLQLVTFFCYANQLTGPIPNLSNNSQLKQFYCHLNSLTGVIPSLSFNIDLKDFACRNNLLSGSIPTLSGLNNLEFFTCRSNQITGFNSGPVSNTVGQFEAHFNQLPSSSINNILSAFVAAGRTTGNATSITPGFNSCIINLGGVANGLPTGQGITDKATLISRGWTVTTN